MGGAAESHRKYVEDARRRGWRALLTIAGVAALTLVAIVATQEITSQPADDHEDAPAAIVVGTPGGGIIDPIDSSTSTPIPTPSVDPALSEAPTPSPGAPTPPTPPPPAPPPSPAAPTPSPMSTAPSRTPTPTLVVVVVAGPEDTVALFYRHVTDGNFDAAYELWSDRMKSTYPRQENLDERFARTAEIRFDALFVAERSATSAVVQANFTEIYDAGGSRQFVGYWELVVVGNRWFLDAPHY